MSAWHQSDAALDAVLLDPEAKPIIERLERTICPFSTVDAETQVLRVAAVALRAKRIPLNAYARPTLPAAEAAA